MPLKQAGTQGVAPQADDRMLIAASMQPVHAAPGQQHVDSRIPEAALRHDDPFLLRRLAPRLQQAGRATTGEGQIVMAAPRERLEPLLFKQVC